MKAIIIGAGRGIRLMPETEGIPKCMMDGIGGQRVLDWILDSLLHAGIDDIAFVGGYHMEKVAQTYPHLRFYENAEWADNNVLESLMCAAPEMDAAFVASYSDIVYRRSVVQQLMTSDAEVALVLAGGLAWAYRFVVPVDQWLLGLIALAAIGFTVFGAHVLIVAAAPMDFGTRKASASATGFIDGWGYLGAGLQGVGTGLLVDRWG